MPLELCEEGDDDMERVHAMLHMYQSYLFHPYNVAQAYAFLLNEQRVAACKSRDDPDEDKFTTGSVLAAINESAYKKSGNMPRRSFAR